MKKQKSRSKRMSAHNRGWKRHIRSKTVAKKMSEKRVKKIEEKAKLNDSYRDMIKKMIESKFNG